MGTEERKSEGLKWGQGIIGGFYLIIIPEGKLFYSFVTTMQNEIHDRILQTVKKNNTFKK